MKAAHSSERLASTGELQNLLAIRSDSRSSIAARAAISGNANHSRLPSVSAHTGENQCESHIVTGGKYLMLLPLLPIQSGNSAETNSSTLTHSSRLSINLMAPSPTHPSHLFLIAGRAPLQSSKRFGCMMTKRRPLLA